MATPTSKAEGQVTRFYDALPASHAQTAELAAEYPRAFGRAIPGFVFVVTLGIGSLTLLNWVILTYSTFLFLGTVGACGSALAIAVAFFIYTRRAFWTLEQERLEMNSLAVIRLDEAEARYQMLRRPALTAGDDGGAGRDLTADEFVEVMDVFERRARALGDKGHTRSNWIQADGAPRNFVIQLASRDVEVNRPMYERIVKAIDIRGRRKGRAGDAPGSPALPVEE